MYIYASAAKETSYVYFFWQAQIYLPWILLRVVGGLKDIGWAPESTKLVQDAQKIPSSLAKMIAVLTQQLTIREQLFEKKRKKKKVCLGRGIPALWHELFPCFLGINPKRRSSQAVHLAAQAVRGADLRLAHLDINHSSGLVTLAVGEDESIMGVCYFPGGNSILPHDLVGRPVVILRNAAFSFQGRKNGVKWSV